MILTYSGKSRKSAWALAAADPTLRLNRGSSGDINWGYHRAQTKLNPDISNTTNKRRMRELFKEHGVPMPQLLSRSEAFHAVRCGRTIVGRPDQHTKGRGFWLCHNFRDVERALRGTRKKQAATHFMEYISKQRAPREYRVHIFQGKSIRISEKLFGQTGPTAQGLYITGKPQHNVKHVRAAAKQAVKAVGLNFGAVDILANDSECWVTEVNAAPGLGGSLPRLYAATFQRWQEGEL